MSFYAYMIKSQSSGRHYYGHAADIEERLKSHNTTQNKYTRGKGPWELVGYKACATKWEAMEIEHKLKDMKNPSRALSWLRRYGFVP